MSVIESRFDPVALRDVSITERVFEGLDAIPADQAVLVDGPSGRSVTAGALASNIRALAGGLTAAGYGAGATVALMAPNTPDFVTLFHAVAHAGGTVTTINPTYTAGEVLHQLKDSGANLLVTVPEMAETAGAAAREAGSPWP